MEPYHRGMRSVRSLVNGSPIGEAPGGRRQIPNPADLADPVSEVLLGDADTFVTAAHAAAGARAAWAAVPAPVRGEVIQRLGELVRANQHALAALITREIGKPIAESRGEVQEVVDTCDFFQSEGRRLYGMTVPSELPDKQLFTFRTPVGPSAIITAGNFPVAVPSWYIVPALLCGNTVVWKPAEYTPAIAEAFAQLILHAGVPDGVFHMVLADGASTFAGLERAIEDGSIRKVGFTGSSAVGARIGELCGRNLQTPCLELGGKNPLVVMADADLDLAVEGALFSGFGTAGQRCTSLGTAIVHTSVHDDFVERFATAVETAAIGDPTADVLYGPMIDERFAERFESWLKLIQPHHAVRGSTGTGRITAENPRSGFVGDPEAGLFYHPSIVDGVTRDDDLYATETFGPIVGVARFGTFDEAHRARQRSRLRIVIVDLHDRPTARAALPRTDLGRHGQRQQLDERRGGAPALRWERQERQRLAPVRRLGARSVHAVAGDELGLLRSAAEGADGRDWHCGGPRVPDRLRVRSWARRSC